MKIVFGGKSISLVHLREKNARLDQDSNPGLQIYTLAPFRLRRPDGSLGQPRTFLYGDPLYPPDRMTRIIFP